MAVDQQMLQHLKELEKEEGLLQIQDAAALSEQKYVAYIEKTKQREKHYETLANNASIRGGSIWVNRRVTMFLLVPIMAYMAIATAMYCADRYFGLMGGHFKNGDLPAYVPATGVAGATAVLSALYCLSVSAERKWKVVEDNYRSKKFCWEIARMYTESARARR